MKQLELTVLKMRFDLHIARASYWSAYANTPANKARFISRGAIKLSENDLVDDAMQTSLNHLTLAQEIMEEVNAICDST